MLNKGDFKDLIKWRLGLRAFRDELLAAQKAEAGEDDEEEEEGADEEEEEEVEPTEEEKEAKIIDEIRQRQADAAHKRKREKRKVIRLRNLFDHLR